MSTWQAESSNVHYTYRSTNAIHHGIDKKGFAEGRNKVRNDIVHAKVAWQGCVDLEDQLIGLNPATKTTA